MDFWKSLAGMLHVEFTSAVPEEALDDIIQAKIPLSHVVQKRELTYQILIRRKDYRRLSIILNRRGDTLQVVRKQGVYWTLNAFLHRPVLLFSLLLLFLSSLYLPSRIYFVTVEGNATVPTRLILSAAEDCGIHFGASRKLVRSEKVKNALLSSVPQLQWAGVNTSGCTAVISVRERSKEEAPKEANIVSSLIADRDGFILSATITSGTAHFLPGEAVAKGQLLISGYTDCGICIRATRAEGEIIAQTNRKIDTVSPKQYAIPERVSEANYKISLLVGKKRINLWKDSRISDAGCGRMYQEYYISLPGGFRLPIAICVDRYISYELRETELSEEEARITLQQFSENYLKRQMVAGQILQAEHHFFCSAGLYRLQSSYTCTEMIGKERREQIGVINGKRN